MIIPSRLLFLAKRNRFLLILAVLAGFTGGLLTVLQARVLSQVIARVFLEAQNLAEVMPLMGLFLCMLAGRAVLTFTSESLSSAAAVHVKETLRGLLLRHLLEAGPLSVEGERSGEINNTLNQGVEALDGYFSQYLPQLALAGSLPLAYLAIVFPLDPLSGVALLLSGPLIPLFMFLIGGLSESLTKKQWETLTRMSAYFLDTLQGLTTLKILGASRAQVEQMGRVSEQYRTTTMNVLRVTFLSALALEMLSTIGTAIVAVEVGLRLLYGQMSFEMAFFLLLLAPDFYLPLRNLGLRFHASMAGIEAARRIDEILGRPAKAGLRQGFERQILSERPILQPVSRTLPLAGFEIEFEHVSYTYPNRDQTAIEDLSFKILPGEQTALVGASGAGKSTVARLLLRFIEPDQGQIRSAGQPISEILADDWRKQIAWVPQRAFLFHGTIAENLRLARPDALSADLSSAAQQGHLLEWIQSLPLGFETQIGEGGEKLSGGQAQRLALARAFLRDAPFLVLDEPSANLDVEQEQQLQDALTRLCSGRMVLVIAHRLPTALRANQILVLEAGRLVEAGRNADLVTNSKKYAHLLLAYQGKQK